MSDETKLEGVKFTPSRSNIRFAHVLAKLMEERYKRNRAALARAAHVSPSALSQYARGRATPALAVLVDLAQALEVSLDYLVYGVSPAEGVEHAAWAQHLEDTVRRMTSEAASLRQLVDRVGIGLSDRVYDVALEAVKKSSPRGGAVSAGELAQLEQYSSRTQIATVDLDTDILLPRPSSPDSVAAPGPFAGVVAENIMIGHSYEYIIPDNSHWIRRARLMVQEVKDTVSGRLGPGAAAAAVHSHLHFFVATEGLVPSYVLYKLDHGRLAADKPLLYDLIEGFLGIDIDNISGADADSANILALVEPPNPGFDVYPLVSRSSLPIIVKSFRNLRNQSDRMSFTDDGHPSER